MNGQKPFENATCGCLFFFEKKETKSAYVHLDMCIRCQKTPNLVSLGDVTIHSMVQAFLIRAGPGAWREPPTPLGTRKERDDDQLEQK